MLQRLLVPNQTEDLIIMTLSICNRPSRFALCLGFCFALLSFCFQQAHGQQLVKSAPGTIAESSTETNVSERVRLLEGELEQQATIQALLDKLSPTAPVTREEQVRKRGLPPLAGNSEATASVAVTPEQQTPSVEQRLTKLEGQALKIGPVRVSGDFRLRFDGIF